MASSLIVDVSASMWAHGSTKLGHGTHELKSPGAALLYAVGAAEDAGVLTIDEKHSESGLVKTARSKIESAEAAMKQQDDRVASADQEAIETHLMWEVERRCDLALSIADDYEEAVKAAKSAELIAPADDREVNLPNVEATQRRLLSTAAGIAVRLREIGADKAADQAETMVGKARKALQ